MRARSASSRSPKMSSSPSSESFVSHAEMMKEHICKSFMVEKDMLNNNSSRVIDEYLGEKKYGVVKILEGFEKRELIKSIEHLKMKKSENMVDIQK
jgi:hypothetical protein